MSIRLGQEILDVSQRQGESHVHHHDQTDDLRRAIEISERVAHGLKLPPLGALRAFCLTAPLRLFPAGAIWPGGACTAGKRRLVTAHTSSGHLQIATADIAIWTDAVIQRQEERCTFWLAPYGINRWPLSHAWLA
jgi:hypothetical protein